MAEVGAVIAQKENITVVDSKYKEQLVSIAREENEQSQGKVINVEKIWADIKIIASESSQVANRTRVRAKESYWVINAIDYIEVERKHGEISSYPEVRSIAGAEGGDEGWDARQTEKLKPKILWRQQKGAIAYQKRKIIPRGSEGEDWGGIQSWSWNEKESLERAEANKNQPDKVEVRVNKCLNKESTKETIEKPSNAEHLEFEFSLKVK